MPCLRDASTPKAPHAASAHLDRLRPRALLRVVRVASGVAMAAVLAVSFGAGTACSTRATTPTVGPDSTLVYSSRIPGDVQVSITFTLKDSKRREEQRRLERERQRQLERERKEREAKERAERAKERAEAKRKKAAATKTKKPAKKTGKKPAAARVTPVESPASALTPPAVRVLAPDSAITPLPTSPETPQADSVSTPIPPKAPLQPPDERVFELEEGARVQAYVKIANPYGRGKRPVMFHTVWLNPEGKRVFKRMTEWAPNDTSQVITTSLTISPAKRTAGRYTLHVYLFRELIAEKSIELTGVSTAAKEADEKSGM